MVVNGNARLWLEYDNERCPFPLSPVLLQACTDIKNEVSVGQEACSPESIIAAVKVIWGSPSAGRAAIDSGHEADVGTSSKEKRGSTGKLARACC